MDLIDLTISFHTMMQPCPCSDRGAGTAEWKGKEFLNIISLEKGEQT
jgi:hypothetical protein